MPLINDSSVPSRDGYIMQQGSRALKKGLFQH